MTDRIVWRFRDGRQGHENQTLGFIQQLRGMLQLEVFDFGPEDQITDLLETDFPRPDLLIGAGHSIHSKMLLARLIHGGRTVLFMRPSVPACFFDLVFIPKHDRCQSFGNIFFTDGVLNTVQAQPKKKNHGLILIGGDSKHFPWESDFVLNAVQQIIGNKQELNWEIFDSRRTPTKFVEAIASETHAEFHHWKTTAPGTLSSHMSTAQEIWVTCDSVSMLYEALTSGAFVGVLELPTLRVAKTGRKIWRSIESLANSNHVQLSNDGLLIDTSNQKASALNESLRCAKIVARTLLR